MKTYISFNLKRKTTNYNVEIRFQTDLNYWKTGFKYIEMITEDLLMYCGLF